MRLSFSIWIFFNIRLPGLLIMRHALAIVCWLSMSGYLMMIVSCGSPPSKNTGSNEVTVDTALSDDGPLNTANAAVKSDDYEDNMPRHLHSFIPEGYSLLDSASGNLNPDTLKDFILVLKKNGEEQRAADSAQAPDRPLLILTGTVAGKFLLEARNDKTVLCYDCGGVMGDPFMDVVIKNGYFSVEHYGGSSWRWKRIITYKYDADDYKWYLHKDGNESYHTAEPEKVESTILTVKDFGKVSFEAFNVYEDK